MTNKTSSAAESGTFPVLPLRDIVVFPHMIVPLFVGREKSIRALEEAKLPLEPFTVHDLRRTARSLLSRADVRPDISERVLGHTIAGVEGIYDRHRYDAEKAVALNKLAALIDGIVNPRDNVMSMAKRTKRR